MSLQAIMLVMLDGQQEKKAKV
jgi:hypothetical protein